MLITLLYNIVRISYCHFCDAMIADTTLLKNWWRIVWYDAIFYVLSLFSSVLHKSTEYFPICSSFLPRQKKMSIFIFENVPLLIWNIIRKNDNMIYEIFHPSKCYFIIAPLCLDIHWQFCSGSRLALLWHQEPHHSRASSGLGVRSWVQDIIIYLKMYLIRIICPIHIFLSSH